MPRNNTLDMPTPVVTPVVHINTWSCPRCQTTNFDVDVCDCGADKRWRPTPAPAVPSAQLEADERERKRLEEIAIAEADAKFRAAQKAAYEAERERLDGILKNTNQKDMDELRALVERYAAEIMKLTMRIEALEAGK